MRLSTTLLICAIFGACSGDSAPVFTDAGAAIDQADSAMSAGDNDLAKAGYEYARDNGEGELQADALVGLFELGCANSDDEIAYANFAALSKAHPAKLDPSELKRMVDLCVTSATIETGDSIIEYAMQAFPEMQEVLANPAAAIEKIRSEGPGADLSGLGYAGD